MTVIKKGTGVNPETKVRSEQLETQQEGLVPTVLPDLPPATLRERNPTDMNAALAGHVGEVSATKGDPVLSPVKCPESVRPLADADPSDPRFLDVEDCVGFLCLFLGLPGDVTPGLADTVMGMLSASRANPEWTEVASATLERHFA